MGSQSPSPLQRTHTIDFASGSGSTASIQHGPDTSAPAQDPNPPTIALRRGVDVERLGSFHTPESPSIGIQRSSTSKLWNVSAGSTKSSAAMQLGDPLYFPEYGDSILDWVMKKIRPRPDTEPDSFEQHLRNRVKNALLPDVYHSLSPRSASLFKNLFWFGIINDGKSLNASHVHTVLITCRPPCYKVLRRRSYIV